MAEITEAIIAEAKQKNKDIFLLTIEREEEGKEYKLLVRKPKLHDVSKANALGKTEGFLDIGKHSKIMLQAVALAGDIKDALEDEELLAGFTSKINDLFKNEEVKVKKL